MLRVLVIGREGQVARALSERALAHGIELLALGRPQIDVCRPSGLGEAMRAAKPDFVVNAAAYTAVDRAEAEPQAAFAINADGAASVAQAAGTLGVPVIHLSTDYVFDGEKLSAYTERDAPAPISVYGRSKLAGEERVAASTTNHVILRTSWVYSPFGTNFVRTMLRLGETRESLRVVCDQCGAPTSAFDIADAILTIGARLAAEPTNAQLRGLFHMTAGGSTSWAEFAEAIFAELCDMTGSKVAVVPISTAEYPTAARRPVNSRLDCTRLAHLHAIALPHWQTPLRDIVERLLREPVSLA